MSRRRNNPEPATSPPSVDDGRSVMRRAPFSDNPQVGARGQRTQQRILDAALRVFGEEGYHQCGMARITRLAGCSRVSFYQYFSGKEDVFRHLTGQVARQLGASTETLGTLTPDVEGWTAIRAWVARYADVFERYRPVFQALQDAAESDETVAGGSARAGERGVAGLRSKLATTTLPPRQLDPVISLLLEGVPRAFEDAVVLRSAAPDAYPEARVEDAVADVVHRTLFGLRAGTNVHAPAPRRPPALEFGPVMRGALQQDDVPPALNAAGRRALHALMEAGRDTFVARGYHRTRVDDVATAAGVSHGAFYHYFESKDQFAHVLAARGIRRVATAFGDIPDSASPEGPARRAALRRWLRRYNAAHATEAAMIRVWVDAQLQDPTLSTDSAAALDWGRRRMARFLAPREFGDVDTEAVVMVALLGVFGARGRSTPTIDAATHIIEQGLLGR
ncbi:MAG TPA: TetR/AcrR family transcriptional regulator [Acidimicrobiales bacterium]|nr:TetR/AcrR family transcriptional regulator [Acidimicrobiales bacterium]